MTFYDDMQGLATGLLTEFKQGTLALSVATAGGGPAHNPGPTTFADTAFDGTVRGVTVQHLQDSLVQVSDLVVTAPGTLSPSASDRVSIGGVAYTIVKIIRKPATGTAVAYQIIVRK